MSVVALVAIGTAIFGALGTLHLAYTFFTPKFDPRDPAAAEAMKRTSPRITRHVVLALATGLAYLAVAFKYWFRIPLTGIAVATACFAIATLEAFR